MSEITCKFCGKPLNHVPQFLNRQQDGYACQDCGSYCMHKCLMIKTGTLSWHEEPCISCEHNPYRMRYVWDGNKWKNQS